MPPSIRKPIIHEHLIDNIITYDILLINNYIPHIITCDELISIGNYFSLPLGFYSSISSLVRLELP